MGVYASIKKRFAYSQTTIFVRANIIFKKIACLIRVSLYHGSSAQVGLDFFSRSTEQKARVAMLTEKKTLSPGCADEL